MSSFVYRVKVNKALTDLLISKKYIPRGYKVEMMETGAHLGLNPEEVAVKIMGELTVENPLDVDYRNHEERVQVIWNWKAEGKLKNLPQHFIERGFVPEDTDI